MRSHIVMSSTAISASLALMLAAVMGSPAAVAQDDVAAAEVVKVVPGRPDFSPSPEKPVVQEPLEPVLVPDLGTPTSQTVVNPDGSYTVEQFDVPFQYEAGGGSWQRIDNALVESSRPGFAVENKANEFKALLPSNPAATPVRFELGQDWVSMRMHGLAAQPPQSSRNEASYGIASTATEGSKAAPVASKVTYEALSTGLKETIVLDAPPADGQAVEYAFDLDVSPGLAPVLAEDGDVDFVAEGRDEDRDGVADVAFSMPAGYMLDSAKGATPSVDVTYALEPAGGDAKAGWTMTVTPDLEWLTDPARVYPVAIDPSISTTASQSCFIQAAAPNDVACGDSETIVKVGHSSSSYQYRGLLGFNVSSIPSDAVINYSNLNVYIDSQYNTLDADYAVHVPGATWGNTATWNTPGTGSWTGGNLGSTAYGTRTVSGTASGYVTFNGVGSVVQGWVDGTATNRGLALRQVNDGTTSRVDNLLLLRSSSAYTVNDGKRPYLAINYATPQPASVADAGERSFWNYEERDLTDRVTAKINIGNGNLHLVADDGGIAGVAGWDMALTRYYNSAASGVGTPAMGLGWSSAFGGSVRLEFPNGGTNRDKVHFFGVSGFRATFDKNSSGVYTRSGAGINADLDYNNTINRYTITWFDESKYVFNDDGQLLYTRDKNDNRLTFTYRTSDGKLDYVTDTRGRKAQLTYTYGLVTGVEFLIGTSVAMEWSYIYSGTPAVMIASQLDAVNSSVIGSTAMATGTDPNPGAQMTYAYNSDNLLTEIKDARENGDTVNNPGLTTLITYLGTKVRTFTRRTYDPNEPDSGLAFNYYDSASAGTGNTCSVADGNRDAATRTHVDGERLPSDADDVTKYCIDGKGRILRTTDATGTQRSKSFTSNSNVATADLAGLGDGADQYSMTYDSNDNATGTESPNGVTTSASYSDTVHPHMPTATRDDTGGTSDTWAYRYDNDGNLIEAASGLGTSGTGDDITYRYCWTNEGQIKRIDPITATGTAANSTNPAAGGACNEDSSQGNDTLFTYNSNNELTGVDKPAGGDLTYTYDNLSRIATVTDARGVTTSYTYDALGRVVKTTYTKSGATTQTVERYIDLSGNLVGLVDLTDYDGFVYDELNRKVEDDYQSFSGTTIYVYDPASNLVEVAVDGQNEPTYYTYNKLNLVTSIDDQRTGSNLITFEYDNHDKRTKTVYPVAGSNNDLVQEARHDNDGNVTCIYSYQQPNAPGNGANACPGANAANLITRFDYDYTNPTNSAKTGTVYSMTELAGKTTTYTYDGIKRLTGATVKNSSSTTIRSFGYDYDRHSNLIKEDTTGTTPGLDTGKLWMAHNNGDEICSSIVQSTNPNLTCSGMSGATAWTHDASGNLTTTTGSGPLAGLTSTYNLPGQTDSIDPPGTVGAQAQGYEGVMQDRRVQSGNTDMVYGFAGLVAQSTSGTSGHRELFIRDPQGTLIGQLDYYTLDARYYLTDRQQSVAANTDDTAGDVVRYTYEPYGQQIRTWTDTTAGGSGSIDNSENSSATAPTTDYNPWRYASGYYDRDTGHLKFGTRYYMPAIGAWTQRDPASGRLGQPLSLNSYAYAGLNPIDHVDRSGRSVDDLLEILSGIGVTLDAAQLTYQLATGDYDGAAASVAGLLVSSGIESLCITASIGSLTPGCVLAGEFAGAFVEAWASDIEPYTRFTAWIS